MSKLSIILSGPLLAMALTPNLVLAGDLQQPSAREPLTPLGPQTLSNDVSNIHPKIPPILEESQLTDKIIPDDISPEDRYSPQNSDQKSRPQTYLAPEHSGNLTRYSTKASDLLQGEPLIALDSESYTLIAQEEDAPDVESRSDVPRFNQDRSGWAIVPKVGTLGIGADLVRKITPNLNARVGFSRFGIGIDAESNGIDYEADLDVGGIPILVDWLPFKKGLRVTGGFVINQNNVDVTANTIEQGATVEVGGQTFNSADVGTIEGEADFNDFVPYLGIGIGNPVRPGKRWGFSLDLGVMFQGSGTVGLRAPNANPAIANQLQAELDNEARELQDDFDGIDIYPVIQIGVTYQF